MIDQLQEKNKKIEKEEEEKRKKEEEERKENGQGYRKQLQDITKRTREITSKFEAVEKFQKEKEMFEKQMGGYAEELERLKEEHVVMMENMEKKNANEKEMLKKNMVKQIKDTKLSLLAMTQDTLHPTTKKTQQENEQMTTELAFQSRECERLSQSNRSLHFEISELKHCIQEKLNLHRDTATRTNFFNKLVVKLKDRIKEARKLNQELAVQCICFC